MNTTVTSDLSQFGYREIEMASDLLRAYVHNNNTEYLGDGIKIYMNANSGCVFISDEDYNTAMVSDNQLQDFFTSPYEGLEGFKDELAEQYDDMHPEDQEWFDSIK